MAHPLPRILILWVAGLLAAAQFAKIGVPFAEMRALYPQAGDALGWMLSLISLVGAVLGTVAGVLAGRAGMRRLLVGGLVLGGAVSLVQALMPPLPVMLALRVVEGASHLAIVVAAPTLIAQAAPDAWRASAMALWSTFFGVAYALTAWAGLPLVHALGLPVLFAGLGGAMLALGLVFVRILPRDPAPAVHEGAGLRALAGQNLRTYRDAAVVAPGVGWLFYTLTFVALLSILPDLLPAGERERVASAMPLVSIAASMLAVPLMMRAMPGVVAVGLGFGLGLLAMLAAPWLSAPATAIALFVALGVVQGATFAAIPELVPRGADQARAYGVMAQMGNLGNLTGTPLFLAILSAGGTGAVYAVAAGLYVAAIAVHLGLAWVRRVQSRA